MTRFMNNKKDFEDILTKTEEKWLKFLYQAIKSEFIKHPLPSHDHTHHFRVWFFAKELLRALSDGGYAIDRSLIEKSIISAFFHDAGMTITLKPSHGIESRLICERYLHEMEGLNLSYIDEILDAIELHDDKRYTQKLQGINAYTILAVADDLDAYGAIGVYRYYEIYLLRGMKKEEIPLKAIDNIEKRFSFMERIFGSLQDLIKKHESRKQVTIDYFNQFIEKDPTVDTALMAPDMEFLDWLLKKAYQFNCGLDFLLEVDTNDMRLKKNSRSFVKNVAEELNGFHGALNKVSRNDC